MPKIKYQQKTFLKSSVSIAIDVSLSKKVGGLKSFLKQNLKDKRL